MFKRAAFSRLHPVRTILSRSVKVQPVCEALSASSARRDSEPTCDERPDDPQTNTRGVINLLRSLRSAALYVCESTRPWDRHACVPVLFIDLARWLT